MIDSVLYDNENVDTSLNEVMNGLLMLGAVWQARSNLFRVLLPKSNHQICHANLVEAPSTLNPAP